MVAAIGDHQVVEDSAVLTGQQRIALAPFRKTENIDRHQLFQRQCCVLDPAGFWPQDHLSHMRNVEKSGRQRGSADAPS